MAVWRFESKRNQIVSPDVQHQLAPPHPAVTFPHSHSWMGCVFVIREFAHEMETRPRPLQVNFRTIGDLLRLLKCRSRPHDSSRRQRAHGALQGMCVCVYWKRWCFPLIFLQTDDSFRRLIPLLGEELLLLFTSLDTLYHLSLLM